MSENNYSALMMKSAVGATENINLITSPGIYPVPSGNASAPDNTGGMLIISGGLPLIRVFFSDSTISITSTYNYTTTSWSAWSRQSGRLISMRLITTSQRYIPSANCKKVQFEAVAGGGGGGAVLATAVGQSAIGGGGFSGDYVKTPLMDAQEYDITIGSAGVGGNGATSATSGGSTTIGNIVFCRGGPGGTVGVASTSLAVSTTGGGFSGTPLYPADSIVITGTFGSRGVIVNPGASQGGQVASSGGSNPLGRGGEGPSGAIAGNDVAPDNYGCGGSGASNTGAAAAKRGGNGSPGLVIAWEYA